MRKLLEHGTQSLDDAVPSAESIVAVIHSDCRVKVSEDKYDDDFGVKLLLDSILKRARRRKREKKSKEI